MSNFMDADSLALTPAEAGAKLAELTTAHRGPPSQDPKDMLDRRIADPSFNAKLLAGDAEARAEWQRLTVAAADADPIEAAMTGALPDMPDGDLLVMKNTAEMLRELGISDGVVREVLSEATYTQAEHDATKIWLKQHEADEEWCAKLKAGDIEAKKQFMLASIILSSPIRKAA